MARKKNWLECNSLNSLNKTKSNDLDISWSSSSSDTEDTIFYKYRKKIKRNEPNNVNHFKVKWETTPPKYNNCSQDLSPVIGERQLELSPTLNKFSSNYTDESPVIGGNSELWRKHRNNKKLVHSESFSDKFKLLNTNSDNREYNISVYSSSSESQKERVQFLSEFSERTNCLDINHEIEIDKKKSQIDLIETISQTSNNLLSQISEQISIDCSSPPKSESCSFTISQFSTSQESRNCFINERSAEDQNESVTGISSESSHVSSLNEAVMYYHKVPRKKKHKKGKLMNQLQKALKNKTCNISMWEHELYLGKTDFGQDFLHLQVIKIIVEFGCRVCMCCFINPEIQEDNMECILILDLPIHHGVQYLQKLKVCKPYSVSDINYCNKKYRCYYNISKILIDE